ncbi:unnamed protein product [Gadus morhua 'NCC']
MVEVTTLEVTAEDDQDLLGNNVFGLEDELENTEQVVELYVRLRGETFTNASRDPSSSQHLLRSRRSHARSGEVFDQVPGFKSVSVVEFRPQKDLERGLVVLVHYAVTLEVDSGGVSSHTLDSSPS